MAKHTRIYTRTGDDGTTGTYAGGRVAKNDPRIEAYGTIDELSSAIGVAIAANAMPQATLEWVQDKLFDIGAGFAVSDADVAALERGIDEAEAGLEPLDTFIHPSGALAGAQLHYARAVCRRAERRLLSLRDAGGEIDPIALRYINRLSDALFVWARATNAALAKPERRWRKESPPPG